MKVKHTVVCSFWLLLSPFVFSYTFIPVCLLGVYFHGPETNLVSATWFQHLELKYNVHSGTRPRKTGKIPSSALRQSRFLIQSLFHTLMKCFIACLFLTLYSWKNCKRNKKLLQTHVKFETSTHGPLIRQFFAWLCHRGHHQ